MTNQTIPPCPVCGVVPVKHAKNDRILLCGCFEEYGAMMTDAVSLQKYQLMCVDMLGRACRELGIETVEQLRAKVQPDPRVAVLDRLGLLTLDQIEAVLVCAKAAVRASKTEGGIIITEDVTAVIDSIIAAKRGEVGAVTRCKCGSYAINHRQHGRVPEKYSDLCDVCYWRAEAAQARADALRWALGHIQPFPNRFGEWPTVAAEIREKGINEYLATLRTIIEKELNQ